MKKIIKNLFSICLLLTMSVCLFACDKDDGDNKQTPVYLGMEVSEIPANVVVLGDKPHDHLEHGEFECTHKNDHSNSNGNANGNGHNKDHPYDEETPEIEDVVSSLVVNGAKENIYYAEKNEDVLVTIKLSNPDEFEIMSFTLNDKKYSSYMFEDGSDMENIILKVNSGNVVGISDYTIDAIKYVDGTEIKDVIMEGDKTVKIGIPMSDSVYVNASNLSSTLTGISVDINLVDTYSLISSSGGNVKIYLYNGETIVAIKDITTGENSVTFNNLKPNTIYQYIVVANYDDLTGNGNFIHNLHKDYIYTENIHYFIDANITKDLISYSYGWNEDASDKTYKAYLYLDDELVAERSGSTNGTTGFAGLYAGRNYTLEHRYKNLDGEEESIFMYFKTEAYAMPTIDINVTDITKDGATFNIITTDEDELTEGTLYLKVDLIQPEEDNKIYLEMGCTSATLTNLMSNTTYTINVEWEYDLKDGYGKQKLVETKDFTTLQKVIPTIRLSNLNSTLTTITGDVLVEDEDNVVVKRQIQIKNQYGGVFAPIEVDEDFELTDLDSFSRYEVRVKLYYDLNDGNGVRETPLVVYNVMTQMYLELEDTRVLNTTAVSEGDTIVLESSIKDNPRDILVDQVVINGKLYDVDPLTNRNKIIVKIDDFAELGGGNVELKIEKVRVGQGNNYSEAEITENNSVNVFINGLLTLKSVELVDLVDGEYVSSVDKHVFSNETMYVRVNVDNPTNYDITGVTTNLSSSYGGAVEVVGSYKDYVILQARSSLMMSDRFNISISKISYENEHINKTIDVSLYSDEYYYRSNSGNAIEIKTVDDLKNMDDGYYYVLKNDISLDGVKWDTPPNFSGYLEGNGYTISNLTYVETVNKENFMYGLFNTAYGMIRNLNLTNVTIIVTNTASTGCYIGGLAAWKDGITIENVNVESSISYTASIGSDERIIIGGIFGVEDNTDCTNYNNVSSTSNIVVNATTTSVYGCVNMSVGGFDGDFGYDYATITNCSSDFSANITINDNFSCENSIAVGGMSGGCWVSDNAKYINSNVNSEISITGSYTTLYAGGFAGRLKSIENCYAKCDFNINRISGGEDILFMSVGGIAGCISDAVVNCYSDMNVINKSSQISNHEKYSGVGSTEGVYNIINSFTTFDILFARGRFDKAAVIDNSYCLNGGEYSKDSIEEMVNIMKDIWDTTIWDFDNLTWNGCPTHK